MAKIGTAHVEIKPVLNEEALESIANRIEEAVARGVQRGLRADKASSAITIRVNGEDIPATLTTGNRWASSGAPSSATKVSTR